MEKSVFRHAMECFLCVAIPAIILLVPTSVQFHFTSELRTFFAITTCAIMALSFDFFDIFIPAIFISSAYWLSGIVPVEVAFGAWASDMVWMIVGALLFASILEECGLLQRIALWTVCKCGGSFNGTLYGIFTAGLLVNALSFGNGYIIMLTLGYGICRAMNLKLGTYSGIVSIVTLLGSLSPLCFIYNPVYISLATTAIKSVVPNFNVEWYDIILSYGIFMLPTCYLIIFIFTKIFNTKKIVFDGGKKYFIEEYKKLGNLTLKEKKACVIIFILVIYLFSGPITHFSPSIGFMTIPYLFFLPGIDVATRESCKKINWSALFFMASCLSIGTVSSHLGISKFVSATVGPILAGHGLFIAIVLLLLFCLIAHLFMPCYAMLAALSLPFVVLTQDLGIAPMASFIILLIVTDFIILPHEATAALLEYGFGYIRLNDFVLLSLLKVLITTIMFFICIYPYWYFVGYLKN